MEIRFNKKLYTRKAIETAIEAYDNLAEFVLTENDEYFLVKISSVNSEIGDVIGDEFNNFVLAQIRV